MLRKSLIFFIASGVLLLIAVVFYFALRGNDGSQLRITESIHNNLRIELAKASIEAEQIVASPSTIWTTTNHAFFLRKGNRVIAWSSNFYEPEASWFFESGKERYVSSLRGDFIVKAWGTPNNETLLVVIPLIERFRITNRYLNTVYNPRIFPKLKTITLTPKADLFEVHFNENELSPPSFIFGVGPSRWCFTWLERSGCLAISGCY
ncbi:MAG: hypothetical protein WDO15_20980 [Bacteroidota bacterium]